MAGSQIAVPAQQQLEDKFREFEARGKWQLSLPAKVVIQQGLVSLTMDTLGMGEIVNMKDRVGVVQKALETLPAFLQHLAEVAEKASEASSNSKVIGAIFVLQHVDVWATKLFGCTCWPA